MENIDLQYIIDDLEKVWTFSCKRKETLKYNER
jgi:hypothetical protein